MRPSLRQCIHARATFKTWKVPLAPLLPLPSPLGSTPPRLFISSKGERIPPPLPLFSLSLSFPETIDVRLARMAEQHKVKTPSSLGIMLWLQDFICRKTFLLSPVLKLSCTFPLPARKESACESDLGRVIGARSINPPSHYKQPPTPFTLVLRLMKAISRQAPN